MKSLNNIKKSRLKKAIYTNLFLGAFSVYCVQVMKYNPELDLSSVVTACITGILTITTMYIGGDSYRKSDAQ